MLQLQGYVQGEAGWAPHCNLVQDCQCICVASSFLELPCSVLLDLGARSISLQFRDFRAGYIEMLMDPGDAETEISLAAKMTSYLEALVNP